MGSSTGNNARSFFKKYGLYLFIPLFLAIAYGYTATLYPQYKVTTVIALNGPSPVAVSNDIRSKRLVKVVLDQGPFRTSFYNAKFPKKEVYGDSVPVKFVFGRESNENVEATIAVDVTDSRQFTLTHVDTVEYHKFNEPISESYGKFTVLRNVGYNSASRHFLLSSMNPLNWRSNFIKTLVSILITPIIR